MLIGYASHPAAEVSDTDRIGIHIQYSSDAIYYVAIWSVSINNKSTSIVDFLVPDPFQRAFVQFSTIMTPICISIRGPILVLSALKKKEKATNQ
jgi:hypothetical protein